MMQSCALQGSMAWHMGGMTTCGKQNALRRLPMMLQEHMKELEHIGFNLMLSQSKEGLNSQWLS